MSPSSGYFLVLGLLCGVVGFRVGWRIRNRLVLPFVQGLLGWVAFYYAWNHRGPLLAAATVGCWALATTIVSLYFFGGQPDAADKRVLRAREYREAMLSRLRHVDGSAAARLATARTRIHELVVHVAGAVLTVNFAALVLGVIRLNAMNAWVATALRAARKKGIVVLVGWPVWSVIRVAAFMAIGTVATAPLAARLGYPASPGSLRPMIVAGVLALAVDLVLELTCSRRWEETLAAAIDLDAAAANRRRQEPFHLGLDGPPSDRAPEGPSAS